MSHSGDGGDRLVVTRGKNEEKREGVSLTKGVVVGDGGLWVRTY